MRRIVVLGLALVAVLAPATSASADRRAPEGVSTAHAAKTAHAASVPTRQNRIDFKHFARSWWAREWGARTSCWGVTLYWNSPSSMRRLTGFASTLALVPENRYGRSKCAIVFNTGVQWDRLHGYGWGDEWWRFCETGLHEYGHLPGMPFDGSSGPIHSRNANSIMAASESLSTQSWWWPYFPGCRYDGDDQDGDGWPDW